MKKSHIMLVVLALLWLSIFWSLYYGYFGDLLLNLQSGDLRNRDNALLPCDMCWYIRVFHYSAFVVALLAYIKRDYLYGAFYISILTWLGWFVAGYKYLLEVWVLQLWEWWLCNPDAPAKCDVATQVLGPYITLASLGVAASVTVIVLLQWIRTKKNIE